MPHYFLSKEAAQDLQNIVSKQIEDLEKQIWQKKAIWNDLGNKYLCPGVESDNQVIDEVCPGHGRIVPQEMGKIPDALKELAKQAMNEHIHVNPEQIEQKAEQKPLNLTKADLTIPKFPHDKALEKSFKTLFYLEMPDGRVVLRYMQGLLYTTKEKLMQIPYPIPNGYLTKLGFSGNHGTSIKKYCEMLYTSKISENTKKNTPEIPGSAYVGKSSRGRVLEAQERKRKQELETEAKKPVISKEDIERKYTKMLDVEDPDRGFRFSLKTDTHIPKDGGKIEGDLND